MHVKMIPIARHIDCPIQVSGTIQSPTMNSHESIPIPVINDVNKPKYSGRFLSATALHSTIEAPTTISQLPTVRPNVRFNPTNNESHGDVPNIDGIVNAITNVKITIPTRKK